RAVPRVLSAIRSFAPDILHAHYAGPLAAVAALSGVRPFVVTVMGGDVLFEQHVAPTARQRRAVRRLLARADLILAKSERLARAEYVADPDYRRRIEERATALGVRAHVRFLGTVPAEAMPSLYAAADVVASVPFSDGLPQSVFESMAAGTPVVVGDLAAYDGVFVDGQTALRVALQPAAIAAAVVR